MSFPGEEDKDLRLAIELSLQDSMTSSISSETSKIPSPPPIPLPPPPPHLLAPSHPPFMGDQYSSIVTRVPNKSVEDLVLEAAQGDRPHHDVMGACGGTFRNVKSPEAPDGQLAEQLRVPNTFGTIKDISVTNLIMNDKDKTLDFDKKDFSQFYSKNNEGGMENVFEPRPSGSGDVSLAKKLHLPQQSGCHGNPSGRRQDVWLEQSVVNTRSRSPRDPQPYCPLGSSGRNPMDQPYCPLSSISRPAKETSLMTSSLYSRSPRDTCPLASLSRSPRDRRSFSGQEFHSSGRNSPDLLQVAPPRRCTSWGDNSHMGLATDPSRAHHPTTDSLSLDMTYDPSPFDDDDPGPRLDAVLRSLSKLTARLGDDDKDMFPNYEDQAGCSTHHPAQRPPFQDQHPAAQLHGIASNNTNPPHSGRHGNHSNHSNLAHAHTISSGHHLHHPAPLPGSHEHHSSSFSRHHSHAADPRLYAANRRLSHNDVAPSDDEDAVFV